MTLFKKIALVTLLSSTSISMADDCKLTFGYEEYRPFYYTENGSPKGMDIDLMNIISKKSGCQVNWVKMTWSDIVDGVKSGKVTGTTSVNESDDKAQFANFIAYRPGSIRVFVREDEMASLDGIKTLDDLMSKTKLTIGIYDGYSYGYANAYITNSNYQSRFVSVNYTNIYDNFTNLDQKKIDAVLMDEEVGVDIIKNNKFGSKIEMLPIELSQVGKTYIMLSKAGDPDKKIYDKLSATIDSIKDTTDYKEVISQYSK